MNTGHDGSMTTVHANSPRDALTRMETMAMMANLNLPEKPFGDNRFGGFFGSSDRALQRRDAAVTHITEITGMESEVVSMQDLFVFEKQGVSTEGQVLGTFNSTGIRPKFAERLRAAGMDLPADMFSQTSRR